MCLEANYQTHINELKRRRENEMVNEFTVVACTALHCIALHCPNEKTLQLRITAVYPKVMQQTNEPVREKMVLISTCGTF